MWDLGNITFADETFDLIVAQDVWNTTSGAIYIKRFGGRCGREVLMPTQCTHTSAIEGSLSAQHPWSVTVGDNHNRFITINHHKGSARDQSNGNAGALL